jgi:hypothetical protein
VRVPHVGPRTLIVIALVNIVSQLLFLALPLSRILSRGPPDKLAAVDVIDYTLIYIYIYFSKRLLIHLRGSMARTSWFLVRVTDRDEPIVVQPHLSNVICLRKCTCRVPNP